MNMNKITASEFFSIALYQIYNYGRIRSNFYLKTPDGNLHKVISADLYSDRFNCEDDYWSLFKWCNNGNDCLYVSHDWLNEDYEDDDTTELEELNESF